MSQEALAREVKVAANTISRWETCTYRPSLEDLERLARFFEVSITTFFPPDVAMQYFGYLRRDPDTIGYNNWVTTLTADPSNFRHMLFGFIYSAEYRQRFGP